MSHQLYFITPQYSTLLFFLIYLICILKYTNLSGGIFQYICLLHIEMLNFSIIVFRHMDRCCNLVLRWVRSTSELCERPDSDVWTSERIKRFLGQFLKQMEQWLVFHDGLFFIFDFFFS